MGGGCGGHGCQPKVLRSDDGGSTWARADTGIEQSGVTQLGIDPRDSNTLYAMGPSLYRGKATGRWEMMQTDEWLPARLTGMAIEGGNGALYISLSAPNNQIWRSRNGNAPDVTTVQWELVHYFGEDQAVQLLATGPSPSGLALYANLAGSGNRMALLSMATTCLTTRPMVATPGSAWCCRGRSGQPFPEGV